MTLIEALRRPPKNPPSSRQWGEFHELTGIKPSPLVGEDGKIPGGQGFLFSPSGGKDFVEGRLADFVTRTDPLREFVERHHAEMLAQGFYLFYSRDIVSKNGDVIALLPTGDIYRVIEALETNGQDSTEDLVAWLRELEKVQPFVITGVGMDFIDGKFTTPITDPACIVERIETICPDNLTPDERAAAIKHLSTTNRLYLWWD